LDGYNREAETGHLLAKLREEEEEEEEEEEKKII
jgi:hypothetical protein